MNSCEANTSSLVREEHTVDILPVIIDGKFFSVVNQIGKKVSVKCNLCPKAISKTINGSINATTNFRDHLKVRDASSRCKLQSS